MIMNQNQAYSCLIVPELGSSYYWPALEITFEQIQPSASYMVQRLFVAVQEGFEDQPYQKWCWGSRMDNGETEPVLAAVTILETTVVTVVSVER